MQKMTHKNSCGVKPESKEKIDPKVFEMLTSTSEDIANEALRRYFVTLSQYGYYDYTSVYRLLAMVMLANFRDEFHCFWTKKDEATIQRVLECLYCSICAIPSPTHTVETEINCDGKNRKDYVK